MEPKISIVVPIYNVEKYINQCIESIINQTYSNLQIILVNDGSPDGCREIIDYYESIDSRIIAIHKENGGLSDARNIGMEIVSGEFTLFIDSDDWIDPLLVEKLVMISKEYKADIVQCGFYYAYKDYLLLDKENFTNDGLVQILKKETLMYELVRNTKVKNFAWGKLYRTELIQNLPFRKGVVFEDVFWAHHVMHRSGTYIILNTPLYYYRQREDSIVADYSPKNLDMIRGLKERHSFIEKYYSHLTEESCKIILKTCLLHYERLLNTKHVDQNGKYKKEIQTYIKSNYETFLKAVETDHMLKHQLRLFVIHPSINVFFLYAEKALRKLKVIPQKSALERINQ